MTIVRLVGHWPERCACTGQTRRPAQAKADDLRKPNLMACAGQIVPADGGLRAARAQANILLMRGRRPRIVYPLQ